MAALDSSAMEVDAPGDLQPVNVESTSKRSKKDKSKSADGETPSKKEKSDKKKKRKSEA